MSVAQLSRALWLLRRICLASRRMRKSISGAEPRTMIGSHGSILMPIHTAPTTQNTMRTGSLKTLPMRVFMPSWTRKQSCWNRLIMSLVPVMAKTVSGVRRAWS